MIEALEIGSYRLNGGTNNKEYLGVTPKYSWRFGDERMNKYIENGQIWREGNRLKFNNIKLGFVETDLWEYMSRRIKYPTQKPPKLLRRIISLSTK